MSAESFPVEVNGPANIITLLNLAEHKGTPPDLKAIRREAELTIRYLEALGAGERPAWHQIKETTK